MLTSLTARQSRRVAQEVRFWMSTPVITIAPQTTLSEALALMHEHSIRRLAVVNAEGRLCGIVTEGDIRGADILRASGLELSQVAGWLRETAVYDLMAENPMTVEPGAGLRDAALLMLDNKIGGLPVVDAEQRLAGIVTESDLFEALVCYLDRAADGG